MDCVECSSITWLLYHLARLAPLSLGSSITWLTWLKVRLEKVREAHKKLDMGAAAGIMHSDNPSFSPSWDYYDQERSLPVPNTIVSSQVLPRSLCTGPVFRCACGARAYKSRIILPGPVVIYTHLVDGPCRNLRTVRNVPLGPWAQILHEF